MKTRSTLLVLTLAAALAACGSNERPDAAEAAAATPAADTPTAETPDVPAAAEPETPTVEEPKAPEVEKPAPAAKVDRGTEAELEKWASHMGDVPFVVGSRRGIVAAKASGKPLMFFYTATW